jgi:hypothetical protein
MKIEAIYSSETSVVAICFQVAFLLGLFFDHEDGGDIFLRNVG